MHCSGLHWGMIRICLSCNLKMVTISHCFPMPTPIQGTWETRPSARSLSASLGRMVKHLMQLVRSSFFMGFQIGLFRPLPRYAYYLLKGPLSLHPALWQMMFESSMLAVWMTCSSIGIPSQRNQLLTFSPIDLNSGTKQSFHPSKVMNILPSRT